MQRKRLLEDNSRKLMGLARINKDILMRLISRKIVRERNEVVSGASKFQILTYIYLAQISDSTGFISNFKINGLAKTIGCSHREIYCALDGLEVKGFLTYVCSDGVRWTGIKDIQLIGVNSDGKVSERYINLFYSFFNFSNKDIVAKINKLSVYALRLLLLLTLNYNHKYGYRVGFKTLSNVLEVRSYRRIHRYFNELASFFGDDEFFEISGDIMGRTKYGFVLMRAGNMNFEPHLEIPKEQETYYKRKWRMFFSSIGLIGDNTDGYFYENMLFGIIYSILQKGMLTLEAIENYIRERFLVDGFRLDVSCMATISNKLDMLVMDEPGCSLYGCLA